MGILIRIILRYLAAFLVAKGLLAPDLGDLLSHDPDLEVGVQIIGGALVGAATECWYIAARRFGWSR